MLRISKMLTSCILVSVTFTQFTKSEGPCFSFFFFDKMNDGEPWSKDKVVSM